MKISPFYASYPDLTKTPTDDAFFETIKEQYAEYKASGMFLEAAKEAVYVYQIETLGTPGEKFTGLVACADTEDYLNNQIRKHEHTIVKNEQMQLELLKDRAASIKPILLSFPIVPAFDTLLLEYIANHSPFYTITIESEKHTFWQASETSFLSDINQVFEQHIPIAYIADGHHRTSTVAMLSKSGIPGASKLLSAFFPINQLRIRAYHRVVEGLNGLTADAFLHELTPLFVIKVLRKPTAPHRSLGMTMCLNGDWFYLAWRKSVIKDFEQNSTGILLDSQLLNEKVLKPILGIKNIRTDQRVSYVEGVKTPEELAKRLAKLKEGVAFYLFPIDFDDIIAIADAEATMPPKSTFFEPRMKNGLLNYEI